MGYSRFSASTWDSYKSSVASKPAAAIFTSSGLHPDLDPSKFEKRESCDSAANPESTPIMVFADVTGSMGFLATQIIKEDLGKIMLEIYNRKPVTDPHIMIGAIGDAECDRAPIQATQFETGVEEATKQIEKVFIERGGGGNNGESYSLAWLLASHKTKCDAELKRGKKGYLFTIGDERCLPKMSRENIKKFLGLDVQSDVEAVDALEYVCQNWHVFHLITPTETTRQQNAENVWKDLLGENVRVVDDHTALAEVIVSIIQVIEGEDEELVAGSWDGSKSITVARAINGLSRRDSGSELVEVG